MKFSKKQREALSVKYNGKCAFCGCELAKGWHVWDIEPSSFNIGETGDLIGVFDTDEIYMPACKPCGSLRIRNYDRRMDIEEFRAEVLQSFEFLRMGGITATSYGRAIRFGLILETKRALVFYFETLNEQNNFVDKTGLII